MRSVIHSVTDAEMTRSATMSACGLYRTLLTRTWNPDIPPLTLCMLNSSTADAERNDPTIRRGIGFAMREGAGGLEVVNLYALRATDPSVMLRHPYPHGPGNSSSIIAAAKRAARDARPIVCAWGNRARPMDAECVVATMLLAGARLVCFGTTASGAPKHPLYVRADAPLVPFR